MKLKYEFETVELDGEYMAVPVGDNASGLCGIIRLNPEGKELLDLLKSETTEAAIVDTLAAKYENDRTTLEEYVQEFTAQLRENGILE